MQRFGFSFCFSLFCNKNVDERRSKTSLLKLPIICQQTLEHVGSVSHTGHCTGPQSTSSSQVRQLAFVCCFVQFAFVCLFVCFRHALHPSRDEKNLGELCYINVNIFILLCEMLEPVLR